MPHFELQKLYIGGRSVDATSGQTFQSINPANGEILAEVQSASKADVDAAVAAAQQGQRVWAAMTDRKSTRLNSSHLRLSRMPSSA